MPSDLDRKGNDQMAKEIPYQNRMMRMRQLTEYTALSRAFIYQKIDEGSFPTGTLISEGIRVWEKAEVDAWLDQRMRGDWS